MKMENGVEKIMPEAKKVMSLAIQPELHETIKSHVAKLNEGQPDKRLQLSISKFVSSLVEKFFAQENDPKLKEASENLGMPISDVIEKLVEKHLPLILKNKPNTSVILQVPKNLSEKELRHWLDIRSVGILKALARK